MKKILVIEDNQANMKLLQLLLQSGGYEVLAAFDAETGIDMAKAQLPDLILTDIQLPGMDGLSATRLLKEDPATNHIRIVALTAMAMKGDEEKVMAAGCDGYLTKPIHSTTFLRQVQEFLATES